jgi:hypothetical protein
MSKISSKLRDLQLAKQQAGGAQQQEGGAPSKAPPRGAPPKVESLHDAARWGDVAAATKFLDEGADVNAKVGTGAALAGERGRSGALGSMGSRGAPATLSRQLPAS